MTPTTRATAVANLIRMGFSATHAIQISEQWMDYQERFSLQSVTDSGGSDVPLYCSGMDIDVGGKFFLSCHYGSYPHVVATIAQRARNKTIYVLIGNERIELKSSLEKRAQEYGITIHFLDGGFGMLKRLKRALADDYPVFVEIDVPWGHSAECDVSFPFVGGRLNAKDALFRLIEKMEVTKSFVLSSVGEKCITINNYGDLPQNRCFEVFSDTVRNGPHQYERLFQLHRYFIPAESSNVVIVWQGQRDQYLLHTSDMKSWAFSKAIQFDQQQLEKIETLIGRRISHVIPL